jgi:hypothetical protein
MKKVNFAGGTLLLSAICLICVSGWLERISFSYNDGSWVHFCASWAAKFFTLGIAAALIFGIESSRSKTSARLRKLENELTALKHRPVC